MNVVVHDYQRLRVYSEALDVTEDAYKVARALPGIERFELSSQLRRASTSIAANIAEGAGRGGKTEFARYLRIAVGSACEVEAIAEMVIRLYPTHESNAIELKHRVRSLLHRIQRLEQQLRPQPTS
ncbi:MAG: four helix bundle protein [Actinomycetota bacterium]